MMGGWGGGRVTARVAGPGQLLAPLAQHISMELITMTSLNPGRSDFAADPINLAAAFLTCFSAVPTLSPAFRQVKLGKRRPAVRTISPRHHQLTGYPCNSSAKSTNYDPKQKAGMKIDHGD